MKTFVLKIFFLLTLVNGLCLASPAVSGTQIFTQPDGTKFEGVLKGDSSFHWIESNGEVIVYNPADKFYYKAIVDVNKGLILTHEKPQVKANKSSSVNSKTAQEHRVTPAKSTDLHQLYKKSKTGHHPQ